MHYFEKAGELKLILENIFAVFASIMGGKTFLDIEKEAKLVASKKYKTIANKEVGLDFKKAADINEKSKDFDKKSDEWKKLNIEYTMLMNKLIYSDNEDNRSSHLIFGNILDLSEYRGAHDDKTKARAIAKGKYYVDIANSIDNGMNFFARLDELVKEGGLLYNNGAYGIQTLSEWYDITLEKRIRNGFFEDMKGDGWAVIGGRNSTSSHVKMTTTFGSFTLNIPELVDFYRETVKATKIPKNFFIKGTEYQAPTSIISAKNLLEIATADMLANCADTDLMTIAANACDVADAFLANTKMIPTVKNVRPYNSWVFVQDCEFNGVTIKVGDKIVRKVDGKKLVKKITSIRQLEDGYAISTDDAFIEIYSVHSKNVAEKMKGVVASYTNKRPANFERAPDKTIKYSKAALKAPKIDNTIAVVLMRVKRQEVTEYNNALWRLRYRKLNSSNFSIYTKTSRQQSASA